MKRTERKPTEQARKVRKKRSVLKNIKAVTIVEMVFSLMTIPLALRYIAEEYRGGTVTRDLRLFLCAAFFIMALARLFRSQRMRLAGKPKSKYIMQLIYAGVFLVCSVLPVFFGYVKAPGLLLHITGNEEELAADYVGDVRQVIGMLFWLALIAGRIVSLIRDHRLRRVFSNLVLIVVMVFWGMTAFILCDLSVALITSVAMTLGAIMTVVFSRVHLDALARIVRKTYAAEIILGLLLLIFAFSYVLEACEDSIQTFEDGLWYCFAIVTTIGFGDITATGLLGRILSVILGVYGIIVVALITSIIVNFYGEVRKEPDEPEEEEMTDGPETPEETDGGRGTWNTSSKS